MDEAFASDDAIDKRALRTLSKRSDAKGLGQLGGHGAALAATGWIVAQAWGGPWVAPAWVLHGMVLVFLFAPLHETIHRTAFESRRLNDAVAWICGVVVVLPPAYFRAFHFAHHRHTQDPARDPELAAPKPARLSQYLLHVSGLPYWRRQIGGLLSHAAGRIEEGFIAPHHRPAVVREARALLLTYLGVAAGSVVLETWASVMYWIVPVLLGQPFLRLYLLAEHTGCPLVPDMFANSRTTLTAWPVRRLAWNMPYHVEHHAYPAVPFHALPAAHERVKGRIAMLAPGYIAVQREILAGLESTGQARVRP